MTRYLFGLLLFLSVVTQGFAPILFLDRSPSRPDDGSIGQTSNISAVGADTTVTVTWVSVGGATAYDLFFDTTAGVSTDDTEITGVTSPYVHTGRSNGTTYYYRVRARSASATGGLSDLEASATPSVPGDVPGKTTSIDAEAGDTEITITFASVATATSYKLYRSTVSPVTTGDTLVTSSATSGYINTGLTNGTEYFYRIVAVNAVGDGAISDVEASAIPTGQAPSGAFLYVDGTNGSDANSGVEAAPFATIERAKQAIRTATGRTTTGGAPTTYNGEAWSGVTVVVAPGKYRQTTGSQLTPLVMDSRDSGTEAMPIIYRASSSATTAISGAFQVDDEDWVALSGSGDTFAIGRIDDAYEDEVFVLNVGDGDTSSADGDLGIDTGSLAGGYNMNTSLLALIVGDEMRYMSRYPAAATAAAEHTAGAWMDIVSVSGGASNGALVTMNVVGDTPGGWNISSQDVLLYGTIEQSFRISYEKVASVTDTGTNTQITYNRQGAGVPVASGHFVAFRNMLQVMAPGEYVWNRARGKLYYRLAAGESAPENTSLTLMPTVMTMGVDESDAQAVDYVRFEGLTFEGTRSVAIKCYRSTGIRFDGCTFGNVTGAVFDVEDATDFTISGGSMRRVGYRGGYLHSGDKATHTSGNMRVENFAVSEVSFYMHGGVVNALDTKDTSNNASCGATFDNCTFTDVWDGSLGVNGVNMTVEDCAFLRSNLVTGDAGASGVGGAGGSLPYDFTNAGTTIRRCTFTDMTRHPLGNSSNAAIFALYVESSTYATVEDNTFTNCDHAINIACGKNGVFQRNKFTNCHAGHYGVPIVLGNRYGYEGATLNGPSICRGLSLFNVQDEPWASAFPRLKDFRGMRLVSASAATDVFTTVIPNYSAADTAHNFDNGEAVQLFQVTSYSGFGGITHNVTYYIRDRTANTFKLAASPGGAAINITSDGSNGAFGVPENRVLLNHDDILIVDNMSTTGTYLARYARSNTSGGAPGSAIWTTIAGFQVGVDPSSLNYPIGATGTPVEGGGAVALGSISLIDP